MARNDKKDQKLQRILSKHLEMLQKEEKGEGSFEFHHEALTLDSLNGNVMPSMKPIVDTAHFWMSDHSRFWYHLEEKSGIYNLGAVLISDTGMHCKVPNKFAGNII